MPSKIFSLILATYGRVQEVDAFLKSIATQEYNLSRVEVLIVDQNSKNGLDIAPIICSYKDIVDIRHIKVGRRGLSFSRNVALTLIQGEFVAFPDDDCMYYPNTLSTVERIFNTYPDIDIMLGRIVNRKTQTNIIRKWKDFQFLITKRNFFLNFSSITIFSRRNTILFDEMLGLGTYYGSCEDADYIVQSLKMEKKILYTPAIEVWHPETPPMVDFQKIYSYGLGFGALCRKYLEKFALSLFFQAIVYHFVMMIVSTILFNRKQIKRRFLSIKSRAHGFISYGRRGGK